MGSQTLRSQESPPSRNSSPQNSRNLATAKAPTTSPPPPTPITKAREAERMMVSSDCALPDFCFTVSMAVILIEVKPLGRDSSRAVQNETKFFGAVALVRRPWAYGCPVQAPDWQSLRRGILRHAIR